MDPTIVIAVIAGIQALFLGYMQFKVNKKAAENERLAKEAEIRAAEAQGSVALATILDERVKEILDRQAAEIADLRVRVEALEAIEAEFNYAKAYMASHGLRWPPAEPWPAGGETTP